MQVIRDYPFRQLTKQTFKRWVAEGKRLWKYQDKVLEQSKHDENFADMSAYIYNGIRELMAAKDRQMALALLIAYNEGHVTPVEDAGTEG